MIAEDNSDSSEEEEEESENAEQLPTYAEHRARINQLLSTTMTAAEEEEDAVGISTEYKPKPGEEEESVDEQPNEEDLAFIESDGEEEVDAARTTVVQLMAKRYRK